MAYRKECPRIHVDVPNEELDPRVVAGLVYFEELHQQLLPGPYASTWEKLRPRMIRVLNDVYHLENQNVTYFTNSH